jgi:HK97 gp10 family phage protein
MSKVSFSVNLKSGIPQALSVLTPYVDTLERNVAHRVLDISETLVPVDTGELRNSGDIEKRDDGYAVFYSAGHAQFVHYGTRHMPARPFLTQAVNHAEPEFREAFDDLDDFFARYAV